MLDLFTEARPQWSPDELMKELGYTRPTLYRYLKSLKDSGFVMPTRGGRFALGPRVVEMDYLSRRSDPLIAAATPHLERLSAAHPCTALVVRWYGEKMLCVASNRLRRESREQLSARPTDGDGTRRDRALDHGLSAQAARDAAGDALCRRPAQRRRRRHTDEILAALKRVRRAGVAVAFGEVTPGAVGHRRADPRCRLPDRKPLHHDRRTT